MNICLILNVRQFRRDLKMYESRAEYIINLSFRNLYQTYNTSLELSDRNWNGNAFHIKKLVLQIATCSAKSFATNEPLKILVT